MSSVQVEALVRVLENLQKAGSPVAGLTATRREEVASFALRRMQSFGRRGIAEAEFGRKVTDLANGLATKFERQPQLVGPLIKDYEFVAQYLLKRYGGDAERFNQDARKAARPLSQSLKHHRQ